MIKHVFYKFTKIIPIEVIKIIGEKNKSNCFQLDTPSSTYFNSSRMPIEISRISIRISVFMFIMGLTFCICLSQFLPFRYCKQRYVMNLFQTRIVLGTVWYQQPDQIICISDQDLFKFKYDTITPIQQVTNPHLSVISIAWNNSAIRLKLSWLKNLDPGYLYKQNQIWVFSF